MKKLFKSILFLIILSALSTSGIVANQYNLDYIKSSLATVPPSVYSPVTYWQNCSKPLIAIPSGGGTLNWYTLPVGGVALPAAPTPNTTTIGSTISYYVSQTIGGIESARVQITVNVAADNGGSILGLTCDPSQILPPDKNSSVFFDWANNVLISNSYNVSYSIQGGPPILETTGSSHWQVFGLLPGQSVELTLTSASHPCVLPKKMTCTVPCSTNPIPTFAPIPLTYCLNDTPPVLPTTSTNTPPIKGIWSPLPVDISTMGTKVYTFTPDPILFPCAKTTTLNISVEPIEPNFINFSICSGSIPPALENISPNGISGTWNPSVLDNVNSANYEFTPDLGQSCTPINKTITVTVNPSNAITNLSWTVTDAFSDHQNITITGPIGLNLLYQLDSGLFQTTPVFQNVSSGNHSVTVKDTNGCSEFTDNTILVINFPKYFTPNGDTYNDRWNIFDLKNDLNSKIYIFDRFGKLLKEISSNGIGWDGTYLGHPMPADDYWFTVKYSVQNTIKEYKSHFSLKR